MEGDGGNTATGTGIVEESQPFDLAATLAGLSDHEPTKQRAAVQTVRATVDEEPAQCIPTVPKLRALLERPSIDFHDDIAYCLAKLAAESPGDVAPSVDTIVSFATERPPDSVTDSLLECLSFVAEDRPGAVVDHVDAIVEIHDSRDEPGQWSVYLVSVLSREYPRAVVPAVELLTEALEADVERFGPAALSALGRIVRVESTISLAFVEHAKALVDHDEPKIRNNAIGCLADVAHYNSAAVEDACPEVTKALASDDPNTRVNAAITIARVAAGSEAAVRSARDDLLERLEDEHASVRANACVALGYGAVDDAHDRLESLATDDPSPEVRERAAWALSRVS